jgi:hypothetical protein
MGVGPIFISRVSAFLVIVLFLFARTPAETFTTLRGALEGVAAKYQIQVGLEYAINDKDLQPITLDLSAKSVDTVLTQLINQKTDYAWSFADSVYDVYPKSNSDSILDVKIHEFMTEKLSSKNAADLVGQIPEIKEWLITRSVSRREFQIGPSAPSSEKLASVSLNNVSFRTLLNALIRQFGRGLGGSSLWRESQVHRDLFLV